MKKVDVQDWPLEAGRYTVGDKKACVAVCTLSSLDIELPMEGVAIAGKCVTENAGMEKIIRNIISNPNIRYLLLCGTEPKGHYVGQAFKCLTESGIDKERKIIGARGAMPFLKNVTDEQIEQFKRQVKIVDMIEEEDSKKIADKITSLTCPDAYEGAVGVERVETINSAYDPQKNDTADSALDENFFTIHIDKENNCIVVEQFRAQDKKLQCKIVGTTAEAIAGAITKKGLKLSLYHSIYLGKELKKAEIALKLGKEYEQDKELVF